jgi:hypothetical protein
MSIVYDYLKQIRESKDPLQKAANEVPSQGVPAAPKSRIWTGGKFAIVFFLCLVMGLAVYFFAPRAFKPIVKLYRPKVAGSRVPMMPSSDPSYVLEGIIYNPSQPFAIINGKMLETRNMIGDFEVVKISPDSVMLLNTKDKTTRTIHL